MNVQVWVSLGAVYLSAVSVAALAITNWRAIDTAMARTEVIDTQQRELNANLVAAIGNLADKTGILTSADYCPVRFRMRHWDGGVPAQPVFGALDRLQPDEELYHCGSQMTVGGIADFGLQPPGRYRLTLETEDGMALEHEFEVLPGVPVDRVVFCPNVAAPTPTKVEIVLDWPSELAADQMMALVEIEAGPFEYEQWHWKTDPHQRSELLLVSVDEAGISWRTGLPLVEALSHDPLREIYPADAVPVPYRYCQVRAITFIRGVRDDRSRERCQILGTYRYQTDSGNDREGGVRYWDATSSPPGYEAVPNYSNTWSIQIPPDCLDELVRRIHEAEQSGQLAT